MAEDGGAVAAYLKLAPIDLPVPHEPGALEIKQLYVLEPWQGAGVAAALMDWAIDTARADGAPALYLSVWEQGARAIAFYARHGFVTVGVGALPTRYAHLSGPGDEARPVSVEVIRAAALAGAAARLPRPARRRLDRTCARGSTPASARTTIAAAIAENRRRAVEAVAPGAALTTVHQIHSRRRRRRHRALAGRRPPQGRRARHRPARPRARHRHRRLRARAARRCCTPA